MMDCTDGCQEQLFHSKFDFKWQWQSWNNVKENELSKSNHSVPRNNIFRTKNENQSATTNLLNALAESFSIYAIITLLTYVRIWILSTKGGNSTNQNWCLYNRQHIKPSHFNQHWCCFSLIFYTICMYMYKAHKWLVQALGALFSVAKLK